MRTEGFGRIIRIGETEWHDLKRQHTFPHCEQGCAHKRLQYIEHGEMVLCLDCQKQVSAVWALRMYFTQHECQKESLEAQRKSLDEDIKRTVVHRAALAVQDAWRRLKHIPTCPHCHKAISPPDGFGKGTTRVRAGAAKPLVLKPNHLAVVGNQETP